MIPAGGTFYAECYLLLQGSTSAPFIKQYCSRSHLPPSLASKQPYPTVIRNRQTWLGFTRCMEEVLDVKNSKVKKTVNILLQFSIYQDFNWLNSRIVSSGYINHDDFLLLKDILKGIFDQTLLSVRKHPVFFLWIYG